MIFSHFIVRMLWNIHKLEITDIKSKYKTYSTCSLSATLELCSVKRFFYRLSYYSEAIIAYKIISEISHHYVPKLERSCNFNSVHTLPRNLEFDSKNVIKSFRCFVSLFSLYIVLFIYRFFVCLFNFRHYQVQNEGVKT